MTLPGRPTGELAWWQGTALLGWVLALVTTVGVMFG